MRVNRYTQLPVAQYNPMSFQELAFAPSFLRDRHDKAAEQLGILQEASNQYNVHDLDAEAASGLVNPLQQNIQQLGETLATQGVNVSQAIPQAMKLKSQYSQMFSPQGGIGQLQARRQKIEDYKKQLEKQLPQNPELVEAALRNSKLTGSTLTPDGQLQLGEFNPYSTVRHIADEEIMKQLNDAVSKLKPTNFGDLGIKGFQHIGNFTDLITVADASDISAERIMAVMEANLGPEARNSILQYSELMAGIPRNETVELKDNKGNVREIPAGLAHFYNRMASSANAQATINVNRQRVKVEDKIASAMALREREDGLRVPFVVDGDLINTKVVNPFSRLDLDEKPGTEVYIDENGNRVDVTEATNRIGVTPSTPLGSVQLKPGYKRVMTDSPEANQLKEQFQEVKRNNPELARLSDKEALEQINSWFEDRTKEYGKVIKPDFTQSKKLAEHVIGTAPDMRVWGTGGQNTTFDEAIKDLGFSSYEDFTKRGEQYFKGYRKMGPAGTPVYEFGFKDSKDRSKTMFVEADYAVQNIAQNSTELNKLLLSGETINSDRFEESIMFGKDPDTGAPIQATSKKILINPLGTHNAEPFRLDMFTGENIDIDAFIPALKGKTVKQVTEYLKRQGYEPSKDFKVETLSDINFKENQKINRLKYD